MKVDPRWRTVAGIVLLALAYVLAARLGLLFAFEQAQVSPIWPPTGLALAALMRFGLRFWPGVFLGALAANSYAGAPLAVAAGIAVGNTLEAAVAVYVQRRFFKFQPEFERMRGVTAFVIIAAMASTMISATIGVTSLGLGGLMPWENFAANWRTWWLGDALGALVVAPVLFTWSRRESFPPRRGIIPEAIVLAALVTAVSWFAFTHGLGFRFLVFPPLIWAALRFGPRGATLATLAASAIAAWHTMHDVGPFAGEPIMDRLHYVQIFAGVDALTVLFLAATKREREWARDRLREQRDQLEVQVAARTAELAASHAELQDFLDNASDLIQSVDADGRYRFVNRAWCATLGYRADEVAALTLFDVIAPQQHAHCGEAFRRLLATREPLRIETEFRAKDGRAVLVEGLVNACAEAGQRAFTRGVFRDITDRKLAERQLVANLAREKELNELKSQFVSMASHELRTPLATLSLGVDFLANHRRRLGDDEIEKSFGTLRDGVRQLRTILEQLLLLGRDEDGKIHCHPTPTDLAAFLQKLADEEQAADKRRHPIAVECALGGSPARVDPQLLRHILHNLLSNACKYSPEGQPVRIGAALRDDRLELTVADRGIGIPPEDQPRLFSFFFRGRNVGGVAGSGLGLLVVRRCVEAHGGAIAFTSALGAGTRFVVTLPLNPVSPMKSNENILVVEDNDTLREQIVQLLKLEGYAVASASNGREALKLARTAAPSLVVSDITMPEMDGNELLRQLRETPGQGGMPVVFLSARASRDEVRAGMNLGADDYLTKPFEMDDLLRTIDVRLKRQAQIGEAATEPAAQERGRMLLKLPHELRTPLTGILGFAELMRGQLVPGEPCPHDLGDMIDGILRSGERLERLATNLVLRLYLELARRDAGQRRLFVDAGPAAVNEQTAAAAESVASAHGRLTDLQWRSSGSVAAAFSPHFLEKALREVIDNAFKFSRPGSPVEVAVEIAGERIEIAVADRGVGLTAAEAARMAPFQQWQRAAREQQGLGLGFAIARQLLEFNDCTLEIAPREGGGAVACLSLPVAEL